MNPLDDHELLLWAMRAGLTRDEVRQAVRRGLAHPLATRPRRETNRAPDPGAARLPGSGGSGG